jgi:hypothetical protein
MGNHEVLARRFAEANLRVELVEEQRQQIVQEDKRHVWVEHRVDPRKRHVLCGRDERQLFICQLPRGVTTVRQAHEVLRAPELARAAGKIVRQGEWFFLKPAVEELVALETALRDFRAVVQQGVPIGRGGNQHRAEELAVIPANGEVPRMVFVRGRVRHIDHDTTTCRRGRRSSATPSR